jgi:hypothetical protein
MEQYLSESSLSRILQHINNPNMQFGVMSPFRKENSPEENESAYKELVTTVRNVGYGYIPLRGGYTEEEGFVNEKTLFIPNITRKEMIDLGVKYNQWSIIHKDSKDFSEIGTNKNSGVGKILNSFKVARDGKSITLSAYDLFKDFFSRLAKGSHSDKKFIFKMQEQIETSGYEKLKRLKEGKDKNSWIDVF